MAHAYLTALQLKEIYLEKCLANLLHAQNVEHGQKLKDVFSKCLKYKCDQLHYLEKLSLTIQKNERADTSFIRSTLQCLTVFLKNKALLFLLAFKHDAIAKSNI